MICAADGVEGNGYVGGLLLSNGLGTLGSEFCRGGGMYPDGGVLRGIGSAWESNPRSAAPSSCILDGALLEPV